MKKIKFTKQQKSYAISIVLSLAVVGVTLYFLLAKDFMNVVDALKSSNLWYIAAMFGIVIGTFVLEGISLMIFARIYRRKYHLYQGVFNGLIGTFFNGITPSASGGQFVQAYTFTKQGIPVSNAASILVMSFLVYQVVLVAYGLVALIFGYNLGMPHKMVLFGMEMSTIWVTLIGFGINFFVVLALLLVALCGPLQKWILNHGINILHKCHLIKNPDQKKRDLTAKITTYRIELKRLFSNFKILISVTLIIIVKLSLGYMLPYFAGLALNADMSGKFLLSLFNTSYLSMITSCIPIPGASGGAELFFQLMFQETIFNGSATITSACNLIWRGISFYFGLIVGGIVFLAYHESPKLAGAKAETHTFVDLEIIALNNNEKEKLADTTTFEVLNADQIAQSFKNINESLIGSDAFDSSLKKKATLLETQEIVIDENDTVFDEKDLKK